MRLVGLILAICCAAGPALAADHVCTGTALAEGEDVVVVLRFAGRKPVFSRVVWRPAATSGTAAPGALGPPKLSVMYDLDGDRIGALSDVSVAATADADPRPKSRNVWIHLTLDGGRTWTVPWGMFSDFIARFEQLKRQLKADDMGPFAGHVTVAAAPDGGMRERNPDMIPAFAAAQTATIVIVGDAGDERFGESAFAISRTAERDRLFAEAYPKAMAAAGDPLKCEMARP